ncbi:MAG: hypothetical protein GF320_20080 [Armatimonadia bacterium]|nr:hypothetical protein [Armatimonadia bacterium]
MKRLAGLSIRWKILIGFSVLCVLGGLVYDFWEVRAQRSIVMGHIHDRLLAAALDVQTTYGGQFHDRVLDGYVMDADEFRAAEARLSLEAYQHDLSYLYTVVMEDDQPTFVIGSLTPEEQAAGERNTFMDPYDSAPEELRRALLDGETAYASYADAYGDFDSIFLPFSTPSGRRYVVAADVETKAVDAQLARTRVASAVQTTLLWLVCTAGALLAIHRLVGPLSTLNSYARGLMEHGLHAPHELQEPVRELSVKRADEVGVLSRSLLEMNAALAEHVGKLQDAMAMIEEQNETLEEQVAERTRELADKNEALEESLARLRETQGQLLVQERLASLGSLTAGIAHEIKNPLNFVNNFAKLSVGLVDEVEEEMEKLGGDDAAEAKENIADALADLRVNVTKISEHGERADRIVRGMLQHARGSTGQRMETDIGMLVDEGMSLAYHAMRGQDPTFNVTFDKQFAQGLPAITVCPDDLNRVILNIVANGCYAVKKRADAEGADYCPTVQARTWLEDSHLCIALRDNGTGMPEHVRAHIFEPFFTTKPTGEGTGLGLSISYEIITQGHGGQLSVTSAEGEFTEFLIKLPVGA